jgi:amino acid transporter
MSYKEISKEGYEHIQSAISELRKKVGTIELLSAGIKTILGAAFFAILFAAVVIGAILIGPLGAVLGAVFAALSVGIAGGIAYLIV